MPNNILSQLVDELPPLIARTEVGRLTGGLISPRTMANLDSKKLGPSKLKFGRKVAYEREAFINFLAERLVADSA
ncbi:hypothetical protein [Pseudodesulfovibrio portus]|uniref:DNA-binding protein n=1 Tax=Pseudodesulfovibrio portus TaxID=231439 RepID=A0ABN6RX88_9BACT|nr:hypothetical protein [Pseudodesulfovibrio portus]BDQ34730.1 hypothetical protein JCM14722_22720 [Pseudodesulfovibrio portus]